MTDQREQAIRNEEREKVLGALREAAKNQVDAELRPPHRATLVDGFKAVLWSLHIDAMEEPCDVPNLPAEPTDDPALVAPDSLDRGEAAKRPGSERIGGDMAIKVTELLERAGLESAPGDLWPSERAAEEVAWFRGRDDTLALVTEELAGYIRQGLELAGFDCTDQPAPKEEESADA